MARDRGVGAAGGQTLLRGDRPPELFDDPRFSTAKARVENVDEVDAIVGDWVGARTRDEALAVLLEHEVLAAPVLDIADFLADPHVEAREVVPTVDDPVLGPVRMQGVVPLLSRTPGRIARTGPRLGEHNDEVSTAACSGWQTWSWRSCGAPVSSDADVIVVGCGPVGLTLDHLLGHRGHRVLCLEREFEAATQPRAGHVDAECMRVWQAAGIAEAALEASVPSPGVDMRTADGRILMEFRVPPGPGPQWWARDYAIHQPTLERVLRDRLEGNGVDLRVGHSVIGIEQDAESVTAVTDRGSFSARYLVGCDGGSSSRAGRSGRGSSSWGRATRGS